MSIDCYDCPLRETRRFRETAAEDLAFIRMHRRDQVAVRAREPILEPGDAGGVFFTVFDGWAYRYVALPSGDRHIVDFALPGDTIGLSPSLTGSERHGFCAITDVRLCPLPTAVFASGAASDAPLSRAVRETRSFDEQRVENRLLLLSRQRATQRLAFLLLEILGRLRDRGLAAGDSCTFPLTYEQMMDALGLSRSQLARSLAEIRARHWATVGSGQLNVLAAEDMAAFCGYAAHPPVERTLI